MQIPSFVPPPFVSETGISVLAKAAEYPKALNGFAEDHTPSRLDCDRACPYAQIMPEQWQLSALSCPEELASYFPY